jgi:hypothetical protein
MSWEDRDNALKLIARDISQGDFDQVFPRLNAFYSLFIKTHERIEHYEREFSALDLIVSRYGEICRSTLAGLPKTVVGGGAAGRSICYYLPSLDNDLAHIDLLHAMLSHHQPNSGIRLFIAGPVEDDRLVKSRLLRDLSDKGLITIVPIGAGHRGMINFLKWFTKNQMSLLVVYSIPLLLSAFVEALGPDSVAWVPTKFRLNCFRRLKHRVHFGVNATGLSSSDGSGWLLSPNAIRPTDVPDYQLRSGKRVRLVSINREEKIEDPIFLSSITQVLRLLPQADFFWTGRVESERVNGYFENAGVLNQTKFIGWVDPASVLAHFDVFADTHGLSGSVSARAFASGLPTVCFRHSGSWPEIFQSAIEGDDIFKNSGFSLQDFVCDTSEQWVASVGRFALNIDRRREAFELQRYLGRKYFCDTASAYRKHIDCLVACLL